MLPIATCKLNEKEVERYLSGQEDVDSLVYEIACRSYYHPAGYGIYGGEAIIKTDEGYFAKWVRGSHCD